MHSSVFLAMQGNLLQQKELAVVVAAVAVAVIQVVQETLCHFELLEQTLEEADEQWVVVVAVDAVAGWPSILKRGTLQDLNLACLPATVLFC